ncbi:restriction endonuclease subunit S [uncultured Helicobacter sp.]|uniref:restriction endonuclease subunit S n=1 Tax=uncultured Helicobacter sp. TaxID=175537 RepID=UPI00262D2E36|nr:restriction endonuclease subunit S [uncultured Helicobacter sp.]
MTLKGYKHTELGVLPEDWEVVRLGDIGKIVGGGTPSTKKVEFWSGTIPWISSSDIDENSVFDISQTRYITQEAISKSSTKPIEPNSILIVSRVGLGKVAVNQNILCTSQDIQALTQHKQNAFFLVYAIKNLVSLACRINQGTSIKGFTKEVLSNLCIPLPPLAEQEKIAEILSAWDTQIQNFETLIAEKQALKKGLCQTLLTAKTRLKGFGEDWEVVRLGDVCEINPKSLELPDTFIYIDLESVSRGKLCSVKYMKKTNAPSRAKRTLQKHDILFQMVRPYQKNNLYFNLEGDYVASTGYAQIRTKQSSGFVFQYIHSRAFVDRVIEKCTGSNYPAINATDLSQIEIPLPPLAEQEKIAEILSEADNGITLLEQKLESLKSQKRGLMQNLLNGKVRVK